MLCYEQIHMERGQAFINLGDIYPRNQSLK